MFNFLVYRIALVYNFTTRKAMKYMFMPHHQNTELRTNGRIRNKIFEKVAKLRQMETKIKNLSDMYNKIKSSPSRQIQVPCSALNWANTAPLHIFPINYSLYTAFNIT
jgi:hypothetical protein